MRSCYFEQQMWVTKRGEASLKKGAYVIPDSISYLPVSASQRRSKISLYKQTGKYNFVKLRSNLLFILNYKQTLKFSYLYRFK